MSYLRINVNKPTGTTSPGAAAPKRNKLVIVAAEDVLVYPPRDDKGVNMVGNFVPRAGAKMIEVYVTKSKTVGSFESDGDEDAQSIKQMVEAQIPGSHLEQKEFLQNWMGLDCYVFLESCSDAWKEVYGTPCAPMQLKPTKTDNNDGRFFTLKFEQFAKSGLMPGHYTGDYAFGAPTAVADATDLELTVANGSQYQLAATSSTTAVGGVTTDLEHGRIVTLIGSGGTTPTTLAAGTVGTNITAILKSGTTWTALDNAVLQLQVYKAGATTYLIELSRS